MTREDVYNLNMAKLLNRQRSTYSYTKVIPQELIDAIIDCAVEESVERLKSDMAEILDKEVNILKSALNMTVNYTAGVTDAITTMEKALNTRKEENNDSIYE